MEFTGGRHADPAHDLVAGDDCGEHVGAGGPEPASPAASAAGAITVETWLTESEWVSSKSSPWQSIAFANAAFAAGIRVRGRSRSLSPAPPSSAIVARPSPAIPLP